MNKCQEAINYLWKSYDENKIYGIASRGYLEILQELVDKAESFEWIPFEREDGFIICHIDTEDGFLHRQIPNVGEKILVTDGKRVWEDTWIEYDNGYALDSNYDLAEVTAWMPLPEPYKEKQNDLSRNH